MYLTYLIDNFGSRDTLSQWSQHFFLMASSHDGLRPCAAFDSMGWHRDTCRPDIGKYVIVIVMITFLQW